MDSEPDEITLPTLPTREPSLPLAPPFRGAAGRKRPFFGSREASSHEDLLADALNTSSDPALFSSDDTPDAENYSRGSKRRKKKTYEGTWWGGRHKKIRAVRREGIDDASGKRQFRRNFDSGIFMGDDSSGTEFSSGSLLEQVLLEAQERRGIDQTEQHTKTIDLPPVVAAERPSTPRQKFSFTAEIELKRTPQTKVVDPKHQIVENIVQECLRKNEQSIDLTGLNLDTLPTSITELKSMIKRILPDVGTAQLAPFEAKLMFFVGNNNFIQFPPAVLDLTNIEVLSLRQNKLPEIPPGIRSLVNLKELNISGNRLRFLPFEIMDLLREKKLKSIQSSPNPWTPLPSKAERLDKVPLLQMIGTKLVSLRRVAVGEAVTYPPYNSSVRGSQHTSLTEFVLRALSRHNPAKIDLSPLLKESDAPGPKEMLRILHAAQVSGERQCTFCRRTIVTPRFQWMEWWEVVSAPNLGKDASNINPWDDDSSVSKPVLVSVSYDDDLSSQDPLPDDINHSSSDESLIPFLRMACGCQTVRQGLRTEADRLVNRQTRK